MRSNIHLRVERYIFKLAKIQNKPVLTIRNTDSYIPPEDLKHVFERFYRVDKSRKYQGGAGFRSIDRKSDCTKS